MRIALGQINSFMGDFSSNADKILEWAQRAADKHCDLIVFPELSLFGYPPCDLLERDSVVEAQDKVLQKLATKLPQDIACIFGFVGRNKKRGKHYFNSAALVHKSKVKKIFNKQLLPVYDVFDDSRHFSSGEVKKNRFRLKGKNFQVLICEDMWGWDPVHEINPVKELDPKETDFIINLSASPFTEDKRHLRLQFAQKTASYLKAPLVYVNMVGGQDEIIFDGG
ncbi:MAG: NAD+ synthase, partial [Bdellovibrionales bacterium]|nr:NAD+ synthase [Bdellovibrionales bacterium]